MQAPKRQPTIQDLLRHTSGIPYGGRGTSTLHKAWPQSGSAMAVTMTGKEFAAQIGKLPLVHEPGTVWEYGFSTDVLGLVVEAVTGESLGAFLEKRLWKPLGMVDTAFSVPEAKKGRYAQAFPNDPLTGKPQSVLHASGKPLTIECGGACAVGTAMDYLRFAEMLLQNGIFDGRRILPRKTVEYMTSDHLAADVRARSSSGTLAEGYGFGLGFAVRQGAGLAQLPGSAGDYNWGGAFGTLFWIDPKEQLAVVYMSAAPGEVRIRHRNLVRNLVMQAIAD
jgi:CubicO group peptidase (beta-lactamase class C family)